jgi:enolase
MNTNYEKETAIYFAAMEIVEIIKKYDINDVVDALREADYNSYLALRDFFYNKASTAKVAAILQG